jgi:phosphoglycerate dehydrogenase-like enzyme
MMPKINLLILDQQAEAYRQALEPLFPELTIRIASHEAAATEEITQAEVLFAFGASEPLLRRSATLRWIQCLGTGVDGIGPLSSLGRKVLLTSARGIHGPQMSELAVLLMLALNRNFPALIRNQDQGRWQRWPVELLQGKQVGILGLGAVGTEIARKCKAFDMTIHGIDLIRKEPAELDFFHPVADLQQAVRNLDFLILVVPLTSLTRKLVDEKVLAALKPSAFLINLARGEIVDEEALLRALQAGRIAGAGLDVFVREPLPQEHPFWNMPNVILTPHLGGLSVSYVQQVLPILQENLRRYLAGQSASLINLIEPF